MLTAAGLLLTVTLSATAGTPDGTKVRGSSLSDTDKKARSEKTLVRMKIVLGETIGSLQEARAKKDIVKLDCVNASLTQQKGLLRASEQADVAMQEAIAKQEIEIANAEFEKVEVAGIKVDQLRDAVQKCLGQLGFMADGNLIVEVEVAGYIIRFDPTLLTRLPPAPGRAPPTSPL